MWISRSQCSSTANSSKTVIDRAILTMADQKVVYDLSFGAIFNDLKRPLTHVSRSRQYKTLNMSVTLQDRLDTYLGLYSGQLVRSYTRPAHRCNFE